MGVDGDVVNDGDFGSWKKDGDLDALNWWRVPGQVGIWK